MHDDRYVCSADRPGPDDIDDDRHECFDGWLGEDDEGRPRPCLTCRPGLARHGRIGTR